MSDVARDADGDVLAGWDPAGPPPRPDGRPPFPTDTAVALGAMAAGAALGWLAGPPHRLRRMAAGKLLGLAGAIVVRRMWRLPEESDRPR